MSGADQQDPSSNHARVARRLKEMADEFEREHFHAYSRWETIFATVFGFPRPDVVQTFMRFVKEVQEDEFSWSFLIRFFFFGFKLLQGLSPTTNCMDEQQSELLDIFMNFLMDRLTTWIQSQGGWDCFPDVVNIRQSQPRQRVASSIPELSAATSSPESQNGTVDPAPSLPVTTTPQNGPSLSVHLPTASHSSASACSYSSLGTPSGIVSTRLAASFGLALGSFLHNRR